MPDILTIRTLGSFSVQFGDEIISEGNMRSRKIWTIFKYIITNRHKLVTTEALIEALWPDRQPEDPLKTLYTHMSRLRRILQTSGMDADYIIYRQNGYQWNLQAPICLDVADFESLLSKARGLPADEEKLPLLQKAVQLYAGDYLPESAYESWVLPVTNYYKRLYVQAVTELSDIYMSRAAQDDIITLCGRAIQLEPYEEPFYERLIQSLLINDERSQAQKLYRQIAELLYKEFGAQPSQELQLLHLEIQENAGEQTDLGTIKHRLDEGDGHRGAYFCTSDMFKQIYQLDKRSEKRMNFPVFLGLITMTGADGAPLEAKAQRNAMRKLRQCLTRTLRQGDVVSQYSKGQYLVLLSARLSQDAEAALTRINRLFLAEDTGEQCRLEMNFSQAGNAPLQA